MFVKTLIALAILALLSSAAFAGSSFGWSGKVVEIDGKKCIVLNAEGTSVMCKGEGPKCISPCVISDDNPLCDRSRLVCA